MKWIRRCALLKRKHIGTFQFGIFKNHGVPCWLGLIDGDLVGDTVGDLLGDRVGEREGDSEGDCDGDSVGDAVP